MKTLYFEPAGCVEYNGINCRIRTAFTNDNGKKIYLELFCGHRWKTHKETIPENYIVIDACHYITGDKDDCWQSMVLLPNGETVERQRGYWPNYTKENILELVNSLDCSFDDVVILPDYSGYSVFGDKEYNYGDEFQYDEELTRKIAAKVDELKQLFSGLFHQRYDNTSYWRENDYLRYRINVSDKVMKESGYTNRNGVVYVR